MTVLVIGGSGSGKSAYGEELACTLAGMENTEKYYLATMRVSGSEDSRKVRKHRELRSGKGFSTIEQPVRIEDGLLRMKRGKRTVLLECVSNLAANEMFGKGKTLTGEETAEHVVRGIEALMEQTEHLVIVSNNLFEDGGVYDRTTMEYIRAMGKINQALTVRADEAVEIVAGIPVFIKRKGSGQ